jgi:hypothetical protein
MAQQWIITTIKKIWERYKSRYTHTLSCNGFMQCGRRHCISIEQLLNVRQDEY